MSWNQDQSFAKEGAKASSACLRFLYSSPTLTLGVGC